MEPETLCNNIELRYFPNNVECCYLTSENFSERYGRLRVLILDKVINPNQPCTLRKSCLSSKARYLPYLPFLIKKSKRVEDQYIPYLNLFIKNTKMILKFIIINYQLN